MAHAVLPVRPLVRGRVAEQILLVDIFNFRVNGRRRALLAAHLCVRLRGNLRVVSVTAFSIPAARIIAGRCYRAAHTRRDKAARGEVPALSSILSRVLIINSQVSVALANGLRV